MLRPSDRIVLLEALRPPEGYAVDRVLAATYSLDLVALLLAPLSFSLFDRVMRSSDARHTDDDPIGATALLQAVREHASRLTVFCEAGRIAPTGKYRQLLTYLEDSVVEVAAPLGGSFHPKVWVLRFTSQGGPVRYRVLIASRNLTFDRTWDTLLSLEGELTERSRAFARNNPLGDFLAALPGMAVRRPLPRVNSDVKLLADEVRRVDFELPVPFEELRFWPLGHEQRSRFPFDAERLDRVLVVSPFVAADTLERLTGTGTGHVLVSRAEELARLPAEALVSFGQEVFVLNDSASIEDDDDPDEAAVTAAGEAARGLHAKLYVADAGWNAHVWTGSANATNAAFGTNVEFLVQLTGKKSKVGIDRFLRDDDGISLGTLLLRFSSRADRVELDATQKTLEQRLRKLRATMAAARWRASVTALDPVGADERFAVRLVTKATDIALGAGESLQAWPISLSCDVALEPVMEGPNLAFPFPSCSFAALTGFFAMRIRAVRDGQAAEDVFVVHVALEGAPADRHARVLRSMLDDPSKVMRFLRMLLAIDATSRVAELLKMAEVGPVQGAIHGSQGAETPLLEALLRALDRGPQRLDELDRTVRELQSSRGGAALLPPDFDGIWAPIRAVWHARRTERGRP